VAHEMPFDEPFAEEHNSSTTTGAWQAYYAGQWEALEIAVERVQAGQPDLCREKLERALANPKLVDDGADPIVILDHDGRLMVMDGHHRTYVALQQGRATVPARVVRIHA
jgi:hypothetical protein